MSPLPAPSPEALDCSNALSVLIKSEIEESGGWIPFSDYMRLALYAPGLGYYSGGSEKFGADFYTAPEISPLFGAAIARHAGEVLAESGGDILELGAGSGKLARDLLSNLEHSGRYFILEVSAQLRKRQQETLAGNPGLLAKVEWLDRLPESFNGFVVANEVLDALPAEVVRWGEGEIFRRGVGFEDGRFCWRDRVLTEGPLFDAAKSLDLPPGYVSEIGLEAEALVATLAKMLQKGELFFVDYGFGSGEYYHPERSGGTLMCHYRQHSHDDPFFLPGLQDITSHVDFSRAASAAIDAGLQFCGYTSQAHFLLNSGLLQLLAGKFPAGSADYLNAAAAVQKLLSPAEMGELFKVIAFSRAVSGRYSAFISGDRSRML